MTATGLVVSTGNNSSTLSVAQRRGLPWRESSVAWERSVDVPAPTLTSATGSAWRIHRPGERVVVRSTVAL